MEQIFFRLETSHRISILIKHWMNFCLIWIIVEVIEQVKSELKNKHLHINLQMGGHDLKTTLEFNQKYKILRAGFVASSPTYSYHI